MKKGSLVENVASKMNQNPQMNQSGSPGRTEFWFNIQPVLILVQEDRSEFYNCYRGVLRNNSVDRCRKEQRPLFLEIHHEWDQKEKGIEFEKEMERTFFHWTVCVAEALVLHCHSTLSPSMTTWGPAGVTLTGSMSGVEKMEREGGRHMKHEAFCTFYGVKEVPFEIQKLLIPCHHLPWAAEFLLRLMHLIWSEAHSVAKLKYIACYFGAISA